MSCSCTGGGHDPSCPYFGTIVGVDGASAAADGCAPGPGNVPIRGGIGCTLGARIESVVDRGQRLKARLGLVAYRVFLVWELRGPDQGYRDVRRVELMPVEVVDMKGLTVELTKTGLEIPGTVRIQRVSPNQVSEYDLLGYVDGQPWDAPGGRFFIEVVLHERCAGKTAPKRWRFFPASAPHLSASKEPLGWSMDLADQMQERDRQGRDQSLDVGQPDRRDSFLDVVRT